MESITEGLIRLQDKEYAEFQAKLTPGDAAEKMLGIRVPDVRKYAKELLKTRDMEEITAFFREVPHKYYDEDMLHGVLISELKDFDVCMEEMERFLPFVDNWAVCDITSPKVFKKHKEAVLEKIKIWAKSEHTYTCRFGMEMLMSHFLDADFKAEYLEIPACVQSDEYYVNMMIAWFFATALAKQWEPSVKYLEENRFSVWVHNKTIQKACESYRITGEQKEYLKTLRRKKN